MLLIQYAIIYKIQRPFGKRMEAFIIRFKHTAIAIICLAVVLVLHGCMAGKELSTSLADPAGLKGTYTLIRYGCINANDVANVAVLVDEKSGYIFDVYALDAMYTVKKDLPAMQALIEANSFLNCNTTLVRGIQLRGIMDPSGRTIAYELKPFYEPLNSMNSEVIRSSYILNDGKVTALFKLDFTYENKNNGGR